MTARPIAREVASLIVRHYAQPNHGAGGCLHVQLDDGNVGDGFFDLESRSSVEACGCAVGLRLFELLAAQRGKVDALLT